MDIVSFRTFLAAAATGSFAGAAERVNASPSSVTERIKQLEHRLGAKLFTRDKRGCVLTPAGERFMKPAQQAVRAWEVARQEVALPERFERSLALGGQYFLWDRLLLDWLDQLRTDAPDLALRVTAGAWARLNRELAEGVLDMIVVHDPVFRNDIGAERIFDDRLVLVTGGDPETWREDYVRIDWGQSLGQQIASQINVHPKTGLSLDLGQRSARWLTANRQAGYMPEFLVTPQIKSGELAVVQKAPCFEYPAFLCWRRDFDETVVEDVLASLSAFA